MGQIDTVRKIMPENDGEVLTLTQQFCIFFGRQGKIHSPEEVLEDVRS